MKVLRGSDLSHSRWDSLSENNRKSICDSVLPVLAFIGEALIRFAICGAAYLENVKSCIKTLMKRNMKKMTSGERLLSNPEA